jgi:hypothetical protein
MNIANIKVGIYDWNEDVVEVPYFQLLQWKHAIHLEMLGLKYSRGSVTAHVRKKLSAPRSCKRATIYAHLCDSINSVQAQMGLESNTVH